MKIQATVVGDSLSPQGNRLTSMLITFPRFILAELNTHRMLSKNSASSRAIPTKKLLKMVEENPFIPIAWQKEHKGMQGVEYITDETILTKLLNNHLGDRNAAIESATTMMELGATKQLANRYLEPFLWTTVLVSGTEWENFFELRCPQYKFNTEIKGRSRKDILKQVKKLYEETEVLDEVYQDLEKENTLWWLGINEGQAEIHMMALAEAMWDAMNESKPKQLKAGEWHIPFEDKIIHTQQWKDFTADKPDDWDEVVMEAVKISTAMAARTSYTVVGDEKEVSYETLIGIHDRIISAKPMHSSPMEHCARAMSESEAWDNVKGSKVDQPASEIIGWCRNYRGFISYRHILESKSKM